MDFRYFMIFEKLDFPVFFPNLSFDTNTQTYGFVLTSYILWKKENQTSLPSFPPAFHSSPELLISNVRLPLFSPKEDARNGSAHVLKTDYLTAPVLLCLIS